MHLLNRILGGKEHKNDSQDFEDSTIRLKTERQLRFSAIYFLILQCFKQISFRARLDLTAGRGSM